VLDGLIGPFVKEKKTRWNTQPKSFKKPQKLVKLLVKYYRIAGA
jgi:hypothetical protein